MDKSLYEFGQEMAHLMPRFIREVLRRQFKTLKTREITISQMIILTLLQEKKRSKMNEIAKALSVTTSAATGLVGRMVKTSLLKRIVDPKDRRVINIEMTEKGRHIIEDIQKQRYKMMMQMFAKVTPIERKRYLGTVKKIYHTLTEGAK